MSEIKNGGPENKAALLCAEYAKCSRAVKQYGKDIGEALSKCPGVNGDLLWPEGDNSLSDFAFSELLGRKNKDQTHLKAALTPDTDYDGSGIWLTDQEITEVVSECPHCSAAWEAVQKRKAARKSFGIVKRQISAVGRSVAAREQS